MRVLLVSPNRLRSPYPVHPLGLDYVAAALSPAHEVRILDLCPLDEGEVEGAIAGALRAFAPEAVGISIRNVDDLDARRANPLLDGAHAVVRAVRRCSAAPVVLGGAGFTIFPGELLEALEADLGVVGEGERARPLFDALAAGRPVDGLPGVLRRGDPPIAPAPLPTGATGRRGSPALNPALGFYLAHGAILALQSQRGCALRCAYCTYPLIEGGTARAFEADEVAREARMLEEAGARFLFLADSVFNADAGRALEVAAAFRRARLGIPWGGYFAPLPAPDGFWAALRDAGCTHAELGTESLSDPVLARLRKPFRRAGALAAHAAARAAGVNTAHFMAMGGPGETAQTVEETLDGCERLEGAPVFFFCGMRIYPGTELHRIARGEGQVAPGQNLLPPTYYRPPGIALDAIVERVGRRGAGRGWILGAGEEHVSRAVQALHARGRTGPLWEYAAT